MMKKNKEIKIRIGKGEGIDGKCCGVCEYIGWSGCVADFEYRPFDRQYCSGWLFAFSDHSMAEKAVSR